MITFNRLIFMCGALPVLLLGCGPQEKLSKKYYTSNRSALKQINTAYNTLYETRPFILNFTDARFKKYSVEVSTDTVRYVYNTSIMNFSVADSITRFGLDSSQLRQLGEKMFRSKCICVARHSFYHNDHEYAANWLFFKQAGAGMFKESRYHVLIFFQETLTAEVRNEFIERQELLQLEGNVFYTISNRFK